MPTRFRTLFCAAFALCASAPLAGQVSAVAGYRDVADQLIRTAQADSFAYDRLGRLVDGFGNRLSGSTALEHAIDWVLAEMKRDGLANARTEPVKVPHWVRGRESAELISPRRTPLAMLGLGGSVGTPKVGITAPVLVVSSFDELTSRKAAAKGKIVLFDAPFVNYETTVAYRRSCATEAAKVGAVACLIRSIASYSIRSPHTGNLRYDSTVTKIPAAALSVEDAMMLHRMQSRGDKIVLHLQMEARKLPDAMSRNVMAEIVGRERPDEVVVLGGHLDSWDVGQGAMDDGGGVVAAWEAVRLIQRLGLKPRRTIRVVAWTNEENGTRGGTAYRDARGTDVDKHVLAMESDAGAFAPKGFGFGGSPEALAVVREIGKLLAPIGADSVEEGGGEADIGPLMERGVPGAGLLTEQSKYFWFHHTQGDTLDKLDPAELARCVAAMAVLAYVVADLPEPLPRATK